VQICGATTAMVPCPQIITAGKARVRTADSQPFKGNRPNSIPGME
jgi:hypothetical protein